MKKYSLRRKANLIFKKAEKRNGVIKKERIGNRAFLSIFIFLLGMFSSYSALADEEQMRETLVKIINQLQAIKPLLNQAEREQPSNPRIKVHFSDFMGSDGKVHAGIQQDLNTIQQSLIEVINRESIEPRIYEPIKNDFVGNDHV